MHSQNRQCKLRLALLQRAEAFQNLMGCSSPHLPHKIELVIDIVLHLQHTSTIEQRIECWWHSFCNLLPAVHSKRHSCMWFHINGLIWVRYIHKNQLLYYTEVRCAPACALRCIPGQQLYSSNRMKNASSAYHFGVWTHVLRFDGWHNSCSGNESCKQAAQRCL